VGFKEMRQDGEERGGEGRGEAMKYLAWREEDLN
jgi:hypothetical protein